MKHQISGNTSGDIAESIRALVDRGALRAGDMLPPVRALASDLGVNRNTVVAAYKTLTTAGVTMSRGRGGTRVAGHTAIAREGFAHGSSLRDVSSGNPSATLLPSLDRAASALSAEPVLYGQPTIEPELASWARESIEADQPRPFDLLVTAGAVDAVERLLAQSLTHGDAVALEDPCFLTSINTARLAGYRTIAVEVDSEGMTVEGLRAALEQGVRAVICTPRAHNPTGACLSERRAEALRNVLVDHPYVLVIEDDHFSLLSSSPYRSIVNPTHERWALIRSVSKFLGPDMRLAIVASDPETSLRLQTRLSPGTTWVSHHLQRMSHALLTDKQTLADIETARTHYRTRNAAFVELLASRSITATSADGLNVWVELAAPAAAVASALEERGWIVRPGDEFLLSPDVPSRHLRLTVHDLDDTCAEVLARDIAEVAAAVVTTHEEVAR